MYTRHLTHYTEESVYIHYNIMYIHFTLYLPLFDLAISSELSFNSYLIKLYMCMSNSNSLLQIYIFIIPHAQTHVTRNAFTILANLAVFCTMWVLLNVRNTKDEHIGPKDEWSFSVSEEKYFM